VPAVLMAFAGAAPAQAQSARPPVELTWEAPSECPSRDWVLAEVARLLSSSHNPRLPAVATVRVEREADGRWHAALSLDARDAHSDRTLETENCNAIAAAAAFVLAVAVEGGLPPPVPEPPPVPVAPPAEAAQQRRPPPSSAAPPPGPASQLSVSAAGVIDGGGTMPAPAPGGELDVGWSYARDGLRLRALGAVGYFPPATSPDNAAGERGSFWLLTAAARTCLSLARGAVDFGPCLGGEVAVMGAIAIKTTQVQPLNPSPWPWFSFVGGLLGAWSPSRTLAVFARADGHMSPLVPTFVVNPGSQPVFTPHTVAGRGVLGIEVRFF
jgi:hypothetical protein